MSSKHAHIDMRDEEDRRRRARRNAALLALLAAGFYVGYIVLGAIKGIFGG